MDEKDAIILIVGVILMILFLVGLMFALVILFNQRKKKFVIEKEVAKRAYDNELAISKVEIQEQVMKNISWELHDNIGQLLSVSKMQLSMIGKLDSEFDQKALNDSRNIIGEALTDIRQLSRSLNNDFIQFTGIVKATQLEVDRFNRLKYIEANLNVVGNVLSLYEKDEIILFRIIQELLSNVIKHSKAKKLIINLTYMEALLIIEVEDDGLGLSGNIASGVGMTSIAHRAKMLNSSIEFCKGKETGLKVKISYPIVQSVNIDKHGT